MTLSDKQYILSRIGHPYDLQNITGYSCWGLVADYYFHKSIEVPRFTAKSTSVKDVADAFTVAFARNEHGFILTTDIKNGDVIVFRSNCQFHCGLYFDGKCLHSSPAVNGIAYQELNTIHGFNKIEYWTLK